MFSNYSLHVYKFFITYFQFIHYIFGVTTTGIKGQLHSSENHIFAFKMDSKAYSNYYLRQAKSGILKYRKVRKGNTVFVTMNESSSPIHERYTERSPTANYGIKYPYVTKGFEADDEDESSYSDSEGSELNYCGEGSTFESDAGQSDTEEDGLEYTNMNGSCRSPEEGTDTDNASNVDSDAESSSDREIKSDDECDVESFQTDTSETDSISKCSYSEEEEEQDGREMVPATGITGKRLRMSKPVSEMVNKRMKFEKTVIISPKQGFKTRSTKKSKFDKLF